MANITARDEYLHEPMDKRLWNESYYFDFNNEDIKGYTRVGFQPYERRANVWFYVITDDGVYWKRDENLRQEEVYGLNVDTDGFSKSYVPIEPLETWGIEADARCEKTSSAWGMLEGTDEYADVEMDLRFEDPFHAPHSTDGMMMETQSHYNQSGNVRGTVTVEGDEYDVDSTSFRDHSWGWYRDWTPGEWGHHWLAAQFDSGDTFNMAVQIRPDGTSRDAYGHRYDSEADRFEQVVGGDVVCDDGLSYEERAREWAQGNIPDTITFTLEFEDTTEEIVCEPSTITVLGYEDRNWEIDDLDEPWMQSIYTRSPVQCEWRGQSGSGWSEATHPNE